MPNKSYTFTELKNAMGSVNVIAVVKFSRTPVKTRGSGYSLFVSITDPSLDGAKLPCIFFHDSKEDLPQIETFGDIIVMHRLLVKEFRGRPHGYGYGTAGFAAAVFAGCPNAPLAPRPSRTNCSIEEEDLLRVQQLRDWFTSPSCPVVKELATDGPSDTSVLLSVGLQPSFHQQQQQCQLSTTTTSLWEVRAKQFCTVMGQIVGIYRYPENEQCVLLYLWNGPPAGSSDASAGYHFTGPPKGHLCRLLKNADLDPRLAAVTGHGLAIVTDWSVPLFLYDEHAFSPVVSKLRPGNMVRVQNVHVLHCHSFDCERPGCLRLIVHGGGHQFGRGVQLLDTPDQSKAPQKDTPVGSLLEALHNGLASRPFYMTMENAELDTALTIFQLCNIPLIVQRSDIQRFDGRTSSLLDLTDSVPSVPVGSWGQISRHPDLPQRSAVIARVAARVIEVFPLTVEGLKNVLVVACEKCRWAIRLSSLLHSRDEMCNCHSVNQISVNGTEPKYAMCPFVFLKLEDVTGQILVHASGSVAVQLLTRTNRYDARWNDVVNELYRTGSPHTPLTEELLQHFTALVQKPVDLCIRMSWLTELDPMLSDSVNRLDLRFELVEGIPLRWNAN